MTIHFAMSICRLRGQHLTKPGKNPVISGHGAAKKAAFILSNNT